MTQKDTKPTASQTQYDKFKEAARQLETDDDEGRFNERLGKVAKAPPPKEDKTGSDNR